MNSGVSTNKAAQRWFSFCSYSTHICISILSLLVKSCASAKQHQSGNGHFVTHPSSWFSMEKKGAFPWREIGALAMRAMQSIRVTWCALRRRSIPSWTLLGSRLICQQIAVSTCFNMSLAMFQAIQKDWPCGSMNINEAMLPVSGFLMVPPCEVMGRWLGDTHQPETYGWNSDQRAESLYMYCIWTIYIILWSYIYILIITSFFPYRTIVALCQLSWFSF